MSGTESPACSPAQGGAQQRKPRQSMTERALALRYRADQAMKAPGALIVPAEVRSIMNECTRLLVDLSAQVEGVGVCHGGA